VLDRPQGSGMAQTKWLQTAKPLCAKGQGPGLG
jgi:hypothetical protein